MKTRIFLLLLSALEALASEPGVRVEKGLNLVKTWNDGVLVSEFKQTLFQFTNLIQIEKYCQPDYPTQRISSAIYQGSSPMPLLSGYTAEWTESGVVTNQMDPESGAWSMFQSGGSQGAMVTVNGAERTQIINCATLSVQWRTNGSFYFSCPGEDDQCTMIFWYRTNSVQSGLPWFIGNSCSIEPGRTKSISFHTPVDSIWKFMGTDKCFKCGESCWLAGWPEPAAKNNGKTSASSYATESGRSLHLNFSGAPGVSYALKESFNLREWTVRRVVEPDEQGGIYIILPPSPAGACFYRFEAVSTATMNESETAEALKEIQEFNHQP